MTCRSNWWHPELTPASQCALWGSSNVNVCLGEHFWTAYRGLLAWKLCTKLYKLFCACKPGCLSHSWLDDPDCELLNSEVHNLVSFDHLEANGRTQSDIISCHVTTFRWTLQSFSYQSFQQRWCAHVLRTLIFDNIFVIKSVMHLQKRILPFMTHMMHLIVRHNWHSVKYPYAVCLPSLHIREDI